MGRWKGVIPIVLALLVALAASVFLYKWTKRRVSPEVTKREDIMIRKVAVAKVELPAGTRLNRDVIAFASFLEESLPPGHFTDPKKLIGRIVLTPLSEKELILESRLAPVSVKVGGVAALVKPGKRAITVKGGKVLGVAGFIRPGNRVDILMLTNHPKTGQPINKTVFENVRVLATGARLGKGEKGKPAPVDTFTLEVTPEEGERLAFAAKHGTLQFALRNVTDNETVLTTGATLPETLAHYRPIVPTDRSKKPVAERWVGRAAPTAAPTKVRPRRGLELEIIKGLNRTIKQY
jgi:pilus assembly protein CpaB